MLKKLVLVVFTAVLLPGCSSLGTLVSLGSGAMSAVTLANATKSLPKRNEADQQSKARTATPVAAATSAAPVTAAARATTTTSTPAQVLPLDADVARLAQTATATLSLRTKSLTDRPTTVAMLKTMCKKGVSTEVVISGTSRLDSQVLNNSCVRVYVSKAVAMADTRDILLVNMNQMYTDGVPAPATVALAQQELEYRQGLKDQALRSN